MYQPTIDFLAKRPEASFDTECYIDYWSIGFENIETRNQVIIEKYDGLELDIPRVKTIMRKFRLYGFNSRRYDEIMICAALAGASNKMLKQLSDAMIVGRFRGPNYWKAYEHFKIDRLPRWVDMVDLFDVAPGVQLSLKKYGARMNMKKLQELPIDPGETVGAARRPLMRQYLANDLATTTALRLGLKEELMLRDEISAEYGIDVRSNSDAQIAKALIRAEVEKKTGEKVDKPEVKRMTFKYVPPHFIKFKTAKLQEVLRVITTADFHVSDKPDPPDAKKGQKNYGVVRLPESIKDIALRIGSTDYKLGIGGLHSKEKRRSFTADEDTIIEDVDARAYYPWLMLYCGFVPEALGQNFLGVFKKFVVLRDSYKAKAKALKKLGEKEQSLKYKKRSDSYKIVNNGTFGNTGSPHAVVYAPKLLIHTTITGQLSLLMMIEELELRKFTVISANTDGIVTVIPRERYGEFKAVVFDWEMATSFSTESVRYKGIYNRDVNSYIALIEGYEDHPDDENYETKRKGLFAKAGLQARHDPTFDICSTAVVDYLMWGNDIEETVRGCSDFTQFIGVKQVQGGGFYDGQYLGKMVRWYHGEGAEHMFIHKADGSRVAGTLGAVPCMDLPDEMPDDVDFEWYVREAYARLDDIGLTVRDPKLAKKFGTMLAHLPKQKTIHLVDHSTRISACERGEKVVREAWIEVSNLMIPEGMRICKKCQEERGYVDKEDSDD